MSDETQGELDLGPVPTHAVNPFLNGFRVPIRSKRKEGVGEPRAIVNVHTGVVEGAAEIVRHETIDAEIFTKVFQSRMTLLFGLSGPGMKVLVALWMEHARRPGDDRVHMSERIAAQHAKRSGHPLARATYFRGRKELLEAGFIAATTEPNLYWINPAIFFSGSRVKLVTELVRGPELAAPGQRFSDEPEEMPILDAIERVGR